MVTCPKCSASLPDWAQNCQFCGSDVRAAVRRNDQPPARQFSSPAFVTPKWVEVAYICVSVYFLLSGGGQILLGVLSKTPSIVGIVGGAISVILGIGLLARIEFIRGIVNFVCGLSIIFGLIGLIGTVLSFALFGPFAFIYLFKAMLDILTNALMIYLIGETERGMPNV